MPPEPNPHEILLVYDDECPFCDAYCRMVRLRESVGELKLMKARDDSSVMREITHRGLDIDQGMVLKVDDVLYYGADAIHALSVMSSSSGIFNRLNHWIFRSRARSLVLYPLLKECRNLALKLLRKTKVNNLQLPGAARF